MNAGGPHASSGEMLIVIGQILAYPLARPELRSALYEVAGTLEGVEVDEHGHDPTGRPAALISLNETTKSGTAQRYELFFDPRTSATLATQYTTVWLVSADPVATPTPPGGTPLPTPDPDRIQPSDPDPSGCGAVEHPCEAKVTPMPPSEDDNDPGVRTTFTYFTIYEQRGTVDSIHARP
jgi:hypothetical protein